jgi:hypothetical protein
MFYQWPEILKKFIFEIFYITMGHLILSHLNILYTLIVNVFVIEILKQNNLFKVPHESLNFFFLWD